MKRKIIFIMAMALALGASAQWRFGIHADLLVTSNTVGPLKAYDIKCYNKVGPMAGVMASYSACDWFDLQFELNYALRGYSDKVLISDTGIGLHELTYKFKSSYLEVPVMAKFFPVPAIGLNVQIGPQVGFQLRNSISCSSDELDDLKANNGNKVDVGLNFGLGYEFDHLALTFRYQLGLLKAPALYTDSHNRGFSIGIGYFF